MGAETALVVAVASHLADEGVATWRLDGEYEDGEVGIVVDAVPDQPGDLLTLSAYPLADDMEYADSVIGVQVRARRAGRDPRPVRELAEQAFAALHGLKRVRLADGAVLIDLTRSSGAILGQDDAGRWERSDNYRARVHAPAPHRL